MSLQNHRRRKATEAQLNVKSVCGPTEDATHEEEEKKKKKKKKKMKAWCKYVEV